MIQWGSNLWRGDWVSGLAGYIRGHCVCRWPRWPWSCIFSIRIATHLIHCVAQRVVRRTHSSLEDYEISEALKRSYSLWQIKRATFLPNDKASQSVSLVFLGFPTLHTTLTMQKWRCVWARHRRTPSHQAACIWTLATHMVPSGVHLQVQSCYTALWVNHG